MENEFEYYLDLKDFAPIYRWSMRWYLLAIILAVIVGAVDGIAAGLLLVDNPTLGFIILAAYIPILVLIATPAFRMGRIRTTRYYGKGKIIYNEDGSVTYHGECGIGMPAWQEVTTVTKTFKPLKVIEHGDYWLIYIGKAEYITVPKTVSIEPIKEKLVIKKPRQS